MELHIIGPSSSIPIEKLNLIESDSYEDKNFEKDFHSFDSLIEKQIKKYIKNNKVIINPVFGSFNSGVKADGDLIIDKSLLKIKCSRNSSFKYDYLRQLIGYKCLNNLLLDKKYELNNTFIYWNPFYDILASIKISNFEFIENIFNKNRVNIIEKLKGSNK